MCLLGICPPPWPPQYFKPSYAYALSFLVPINSRFLVFLQTKYEGAFALRSSIHFVRQNFFFFFFTFFAYNLFQILTCFQLMTPLVLNICALFNVRLMNDLLFFFCHSECKAADQR